MKIYMKLALKVVMSTHINVSLCCSISTAEFLNCCNSWWYWLTTRSWCHGASLSWVQSILKIRSLSMLCEYSYGWLLCIPCRLCVFGCGGWSSFAIWTCFAQIWILIQGQHRLPIPLPSLNSAVSSQSKWIFITSISGFFCLWKGYLSPWSLEAFVWWIWRCNSTSNNLVSIK